MKMKGRMYGVGLYRDSVKKSLGRERIIRGCSVRRMPVGRFLGAMERLQDAPEEWLEEILPGKGEMDLLTAVRKLDALGVKRAVMKAAQILPGYAVKLFAEISGIDEEKLLNDPAIGLDGFLELMEAFWEVNRLGNFFGGAARFLGSVRAQMRNAGSNG